MQSSTTNVAVVA